MDNKPDRKPTEGSSSKRLFLLLGLCAVLLCGVLLYAIISRNIDLPNSEIVGTEAEVEYQSAITSEEIIDGVHVPTGLIVAEGFETVRAQCTACHSGKLVAQNRATREGWEEMIRWMQKSQGLWPLGENEPVILDYLATNYGPQETGRRANLEEVEWYILEGGK